jgi:hypothetical protein
MDKTANITKEGTFNEILHAVSKNKKHQFNKGHGHDTLQAP